MISFIQTVNSTAATFITVQQSTATANAKILWGTATNADIGTYSIQVSATAQTGIYTRQTRSASFNLYVAQTGLCFVTAEQSSDVTFRLNSEDASSTTLLTFNVTCGDYTSISY